MPRQSSYTGRYKMIPERIMQLRREMGWTQAELCDAVSENRPDDGNGTTKLQSSVVSAWETGRRPVPDEYAETIAKIFGVTKGDLDGFTDDPKTEASEPQAVSNRDQKIEIPLESLFKFHDMPVYVVFPTKQHMDGWGIYDDEYKQIVFRPKATATSSTAAATPTAVCSTAPTTSVCATSRDISPSTRWARPRISAA